MGVFSVQLKTVLQLLPATRFTRNLLLVLSLLALNTVLGGITLIRLFLLAEFPLVTMPLVRICVASLSCYLEKPDALEGPNRYGRLLCDREDFPEPLSAIAQLV